MTVQNQICWMLFHLKRKAIKPLLGPIKMSMGHKNTFSAQFNPSIRWFHCHKITVSAYRKEMGLSWYIHRLPVPLTVPQKQQYFRSFSVQNLL